MRVFGAWCGVVWCGVVWCGVVWCVVGCDDVFIRASKLLFCNIRIHNTELQKDSLSGALLHLLPTSRLPPLHVALEVCEDLFQ